MTRLRQCFSKRWPRFQHFPKQKHPKSSNFFEILLDIWKVFLGFGKKGATTDKVLKKFLRSFYEVLTKVFMQFKNFIGFTKFLRSYAFLGYRSIGPLRIVK